MSDICGKCGATGGNLETTHEYIMGGLRVPVTRCVLCGERWYPQQTAPCRAIDPPQPHVQASPAKETSPCKVLCCDGEYRATPQTKWPFCKTHLKRMENWKKRGMKTPPPMIQPEPGVWIDNPARAGRGRRKCPK